MGSVSASFDAGSSEDQTMGVLRDMSCCLPSPPGGWTGPILLVQAAAGDAGAPSCPPSVPSVIYQGLSGLSAPDAECSCECGAPSGAGCHFSGVRVMVDSSVCACSLNGCFAIAIGQIKPGTCITGITKEPPGTVQSIEYKGVLVPEGSCDPQTSQNLPPFHWDKQVVACAAPYSGPSPCSTGELCFGAAPAEGESVCFFTPGNTPCPPGPYTQRTLSYSSAKDDRVCSPCTCGPPENMDCSVTLEGYETAQCDPPVLTQVISTHALPPACVTGPNAKYFRQSPSVVKQAGTCSPSASMPLGRVEGVGPVTFCCLQR